MGFGVIIATGIIVFFLLSIYAEMYMLFLTTGTSYATKIKEISELNYKRLHSACRLINVSIANNRRRLSVVIENIGAIKIGDYTTSDLFIHYKSSSSYLDLWIPYSEISNIRPYWRISLQEPDIINPGILDPNETAVISVVLESPVGTNCNDNYIKFVDNRGVACSVYFPC